jgi:integrase
VKLPDFPLEVRKKNSVVKIYRHQNAGYDEFKVGYYVNGGRKFETFADFDRAKKRADDINDSVIDGNLEGLALSKEECILYRRASDALQGLGIELDVAAREYAEAKEILGKLSLVDASREYMKRHPTALKQMTVPDLLAELLKDKRADGASEVYLKDLELRLGKFADAFQLNVSALNAELINEFLRNLKSGGRSRNNYRRAIGTLLKYGETKKAAPRDFIDLNEIARAKEAEFEIEIFSSDEMVKLLKAAQVNPEALKPGFNRRYAAGQGLLPLLLLGGFAGLRTAEVLRQKWTDIHLDREQPFIRVTAAKGNTAQKRLVPIHQNLKQWLLLCQKDDGLCCDLARPIDAVMRLSERANVEWKHNALRHSFISYRVAETQNIPQTSLEAGNSVKMINRHYRELVTPEQSKGWFNILPGRVA